MKLNPMTNELQLNYYDRRSVYLVCVIKKENKLRSELFWGNVYYFVVINLTFRLTKTANQAYSRHVIVKKNIAKFKKRMLFKKRRQIKQQCMLIFCYLILLHFFSTNHFQYFPHWICLYLISKASDSDKFWNLGVRKMHEPGRLFVG